MKQVVKQTTRERNTLDLIFTNIADSYDNPEILAPLSTSDRNVIKWNSRRFITEKGNKVKVKVRPITNQQLDLFGTVLNNHMFGPQFLLLQISMRKQSFFFELLRD